MLITGRPPGAPPPAREFAPALGTTGDPDIERIVDFLSRQISGGGMFKFFLEPSAVADD